MSLCFSNFEHGDVIHRGNNGACVDGRTYVMVSARYINSNRDDAFKAINRVCCLK